ncbi:hypothetical protein [Pseudonocardia parietis]|uniref:Uncharacterized protein n=1 Tax=Pseudonocardia parietis TaxID=570936 RepID=A0ABS4VQQ4_9PSEU|nr:hypothetical protein [Pseudonocardia parietis]MBP2365919.1 hypothetical protein [Pseudonocardia parietis]
MIIIKPTTTVPPEAPGPARPTRRAHRPSGRPVPGPRATSTGPGRPGSKRPAGPRRPPTRRPATPATPGDGRG